MDNEAKIQKACDILSKFKVGENLSYLIIDAYTSDVPGVEFDEGHEWSPDEHFRKFTYESKTFELKASNKRMTWGGEEYWSDFTLKVNDEIVLTSILTTSIGGEWTVREVSISPVLVKQARLDAWMKDLQVVVTRCKKNGTRLAKRWKMNVSRSRHRKSIWATTNDGGQYAQSAL